MAKHASAAQTVLFICTPCTGLKRGVLQNIIKTGCWEKSFVAKDRAGRNARSRWIDKTLMSAAIRQVHSLMDSNNYKLCCFSVLLRAEECLYEYLVIRMRPSSTTYSDALIRRSKFVRAFLSSMQMVIPTFPLEKREGRLKTQTVISPSLQGCRHAVMPMQCRESLARLRCFHAKLVFPIAASGFPSVALQ